MNISENDRLGAVLFYSYWTKRTGGGKSTDCFKVFAGIEYYRYDQMRMMNEGWLSENFLTGKKGSRRAEFFSVLVRVCKITQVISKISAIKTGSRGDSSGSNLFF